MHKVISINLNGNAYQLDEAGYEALRAYLAHADERLQGNPDRDEILADLEQAIADKCHACLGPHKTVVSTDEVTRIVAEMGPVEGTADAKGEPASEPAASGAAADETRSVPPRRLYRVPGGAMIAGVCTGLAAYFRVDVALVRAAFVVAGFLTKGVAIIAYVVMMFVIPEASTPEEAAGGAPLNAKDVIDRAKRRSSEVGREWRRHWRRQRRDWRKQWPAAPLAYGPPPVAATLLIVSGFVNMALLLVMAAMMISLVNTGAILGWQLPPDVPVWAGALVLLIAYQIVVAPFRAARHWNRLPDGGVASAPVAFWSAVASMIGLAFAIWLAWNHIFEIREFLQRLPGLFRDFAWAMRDLMSRSR